MKRLFAYPYIIWLGIFIIVPLLLVLHYSLTGVNPDGSTYYTLENYARFFEASYEGEPFFSRIYVSVTLRSIWLALISTVCCFILGYPVAYIMAGKGFSEKSFILFLFMVPMWMNFLLRTYAWLTILERNGIINTFLRHVGLPTIDLLYTDAAVVLGMVYNFLPFMVLPIYTVLKKMDINIIEAAQDLGANSLKIFLRVVFPLSLPGVISGITMVFMPGVSTFIISNLLGGSQYVLIGNLIEQQFLLVGNWRFGSAIAVVLMVLVLISMAIFALVDRQKDDEKESVLI
jgi:spermidine/putrescine transport system permease protein